MQKVRTFTDRWKNNFVSNVCDTCKVEFKDGDRVVYTINANAKNGRLRHSKCFTYANGDPIYDI